MSATGRKNRDPNFSQEQLDFLVDEVNKNTNNLFGKEHSKEEKEILWEDISEKLNQLDPKGFRRSGLQVKRKYIKFQSEQRVKAKGKTEVGTIMGLESQTAAESITVQQQDMNSNQLTATTTTLPQTHQMSFVDIIGVIPDMGQGGQVGETTHVQITQDQDQRHDQGQPMTVHLEPVNNGHTRRQEDFLREKIALKKIGLFMKMKKYQRMGHLNTTDVRLINRWIKSPSTMPFKTLHKNPQ